MSTGTRVRITKVSSEFSDESLDYSGMVGAEGVITEDPIGEFRAILGVDQVLPHTVLLDDPTLDPMYEQIKELDPEHVGIIYLAEDEVETINTEDTVNA